MGQWCCQWMFKGDQSPSSHPTLHSLKGHVYQQVNGNSVGGATVGELLCNLRAFLYFQILYFPALCIA